VYLIAAIRRESTTKTGLYRSVDETGGAILAATMTTAAGFGAFLIADNGGLRSIGEVAAIGVLMASLAAMLAVPSLSALVQRRRDRLNGDRARASRYSISIATRRSAQASVPVLPCTAWACSGKLPGRPTTSAIV